MSSFIDSPNGIFPSVCSLDCPDQCGLLLHKKDGRITKVEGDPDHPVTKGFICNKVRNMTERIYDEKRLKYPMKRIGSKGEGKFVRISWEEAIDTITTHWKELLKSDGPESILPYSFYGNMGKLVAESMDRRFFHRLGASQLDRSICNSAGSEGYKYTMGGSYGIDPEETIHTKLFIFWGVNAVSTNMHQATLAQQARKQHDAKIVVIDVHKNKTARLADWFIPILPGTDTALALGLMHVLFAEGMVDASFLEQFTVGHEELREHVLQYDPVTVSNLTGVPVEDIIKLARMYGKTSPAFIRIGNGPQHHDNGGMFVRTVACLPALTGQWLVKGGGAIKGNSAYLSYDTNKLQRPDLLKNKKTRVVNMNLLGEALVSLDDPPVKSLYVYGSNPAVVAPAANKVQRGLERDDLFTVVHDLFLTETAKYADLVLPATSSFENTDFYTSYWHHYIHLQQPVIEPFEESKSNMEVFRLLAKGMGFSEEAFDERDEELIAQSLEKPMNPYMKKINYVALTKHQYLKADVKFPERLPTPSGKIELYSEKMKQDGYPPLPTYVPLIKDSDHPFQFIAAPNHNFLNSTFANQKKHVKLEKEPVVVMNGKDAEKLNVVDGEQVRVWNEQGECVLKASVGDTVLPGVAVTQGLWGAEDDTKHLVNKLTPDRISDMGGGATFFSGRVSIERL
ncbi:molybdopterin-containing oxidoreductase family protein [Fictibacillus phosphorivorans]|uniref:molybdopterin-containing oxidoreductase family protein n=1 Tax=Fictibacillus phosphorivorans TaxID=1221500 RepID=UPI00203BF64E|nr:molybdopterin oxidoreductase family protein [Fictibacillus phosphorivorans]MCM3718321.1 molybdopterin oxidoreductase family protein [Fictibacillus phosphorivorans]MCM3775815.1 molybdopterin oxidoreductase family protein [Fictibacillus phosphorivorans]